MNTKMMEMNALVSSNFQRKHEDLAHVANFKGEIKL